MLTGEVPFKGEGQVAVAMKHVREPFPDVRAKRPEVSAALAAVVDKATAKRAQDRYATSAEMIADLEDVLAIETARAGQATGEVTTCCGRCRGQATARTVRIRHRVAWLLLQARAARRRRRAGVVPCSELPARRRATTMRRRSPRARAHGSPVPHLRDGFNPLGNPTYEAPNPGNAIDGDTRNAWRTQDYYSRKLGKAGTGLYVDAGQPAERGSSRSSPPRHPASPSASMRAPMLAALKAPPGNGLDAGLGVDRRPTADGDPAERPEHAVSLLPRLDHRLGNQQTVALAELNLYR